MQQTRVLQGLPYYLSFIEKYPTVQDLASAALDDILKLWEGLGYYSRARNLHKCAEQIVANHEGKFPNTYDGLLNLKGIGPYTAAAIGSFAYDLPLAVLDGNVFRVLARVSGNESDISSHEGKKVFQQLAQENIDKSRPAEYNQAIMELGALICKPQNPNCQVCPLESTCSAVANGNQANLPVKIKKVKIRKRYILYLILEYGGKVLVRKRGEKDIWQELHDFYSIEDTSEEVLDADHFLPIIKSDLIDGSFAIENESAVFKHQLTHRTLFCKFIHIRLKDEWSMQRLAQQYGLKIVNREVLEDLARPILVVNYLDKYYL